MFWIENVDNTDVFRCCYESRAFSSLPYSANEQRYRSWKGAQPGSWPMEIFLTVGVMLSLWMVVGQGAGICSFSSPWVQILSCPGLQTFLRFWSFGEIFAQFTKSVLLGFCNRWSGTDCKSFTRWQENYIVYRVFCTFIIIIIISSSSINISFVFLLYCLYLNTRVSPFLHFSSPSCSGGRGGVSELALSCRLPA